MTEKELALLEQLWRGSMPIKQIARKMGYCERTIIETTHRLRPMFPKRRKSFTREEHDMWADRVLSGELTRADVARLADINVSTITRWVRERGAR